MYPVVAHVGGPDLYHHGVTVTVVCGGGIGGEEVTSQHSFLRGEEGQARGGEWKVAEVKTTRLRFACISRWRRKIVDQGREERRRGQEEVNEAPPPPV
jgi:hypothetical protein